MHSYKRSTRVAELIQQEISKIILEMKECGMGFVTITDVKLTDDLQEARVFYSVIGSQEEVDKTTEILEKSLKSIRRELALGLNLRKTPVLNLIYDDTSEKASRIFDLLEKLEREKPPVKEDPETES